MRSMANARRLAFMWLAAALASVSSLAAAPEPPIDSAIRAAGREWVATQEGIGLTIGVYDNGQRRFFNFGTTQTDSGRLPTKDTVYEIGSISKTMAGQLLARAVVE